MSYDITGDGLASTLFNIGSESGEITLAQPLSIDTSTDYVVSNGGSVVTQMIVSPSSFTVECFRFGSHYFLRLRLLCL